MAVIRTFIRMVTSAPDRPPPLGGVLGGARAFEHQQIRGNGGRHIPFLAKHGVRGLENIIERVAVDLDARVTCAARLSARLAAGQTHSANEDQAENKRPKLQSGSHISVFASCAIMVSPPRWT